MRFYTNVALRKDEILVREWNDGKRVNRRVPYRPYLFLNSPHPTEYTTIKGNHVLRRDFDSVSDAREFTRKYKDVKGMPIYGLDKFAYTYIYDNYAGQIDFDLEKIVVPNLDIEVAADEGFPDISAADKPINSIATEVKGKYYVFSCVEYNNTRDDLVYCKCVDEEQLLRRFIEFWEKLHPDAVTGWNIEFFDIPYLVNRLIVVLGKEMAKRISPWGILIKRRIETRGREQEVYTPVGVSVLDYYHLYRKFVPVQRESYKLDYIAHYELKENKIDHSDEGSIYELYKTNPQKFIDYNVHDCVLVRKLEAKLKLLELVFTIAYDAKVNYEDALGSVLLWDVITTNYLMDRKKVVPQFNRGEQTMIIGAHVKNPQIGKFHYVVSLDLESLYPKLIEQYNISPDTFVGKLPKRFTIEEFVSGKFDMADWLAERQVGVTGNCCLYSNKFKGFFPELMAQQFRLRKQYKTKMLELKKENETNPSDELKRQISKYDNFQGSKKIQLNSLYGVLSNPFFRWYDIDNAEAVTTSGQIVIQKAERAVNAYLNKILKSDTDRIIASDTDSIFVNLEDLVVKMFPGGVQDTSKVIDLLDKFSKEKLEPLIKKVFEEHAKETNAFTNAMYMKREAICDKAIWQATKRYMLNVWDNEGVRFREPELKIKGIEAIRASTPEVCRTKIKDAIKIIMNKTEDDLIEFVNQFRKEHATMTFEQIAFPRTVNGILQYEDAASLYKKGTPIQVKASIIYNHLIRTKGLDRQFPVIFDKDKIKWVYLIEQNPTTDFVIASPDDLPVELGIHKYIDYDAMFVKSFLDPLKGILDAIGWQYERENNLEEFFG